LDVFTAFFDLMGLDVPDRGALPRLIRREIVAVRNRYDADPVQAIFRGAELLEAIAQALGPATADRITWWAREIYETDPRDHLDVSHWKDLLRYARERPAVSHGRSP
jgi:hypothetical protein